MGNSELKSMETLNENIIINKYPKIFVQNTVSMKDICTFYGLNVRKGWFHIIDSLSNNIQENVDKRGIEQIEAKQVKEKFGSLRFYVNYYDKEVDDLIRDAAYQASITCEQCGNPGTMKNNEGFIQVSCDGCHNTDEFTM